jgi:hypothetical protein
MTPFDEAINLIHIALNATALWLVWHFTWRRACQERYRQTLFEVRDELFDFARDGGIDFSDPAYIALRSHINSMIRFSHLISVTRLATFLLFQRYIGELPSTPSLKSALAEVRGAATKEFLEDILDNVRTDTLKHLLFSSPHMVIAGPVLRLLDKWISKKPVAVSSPARTRQVVVQLIEVQARVTYKSEAMKRRLDPELVSVA